MKPPVKNADCPEKPSQNSRATSTSRTPRRASCGSRPMAAILSGIEKKISAALPVLSAATAQKARASR